jgi:hypothetical protein
MNHLERLIEILELNTVAAMDALQSAGAVSDNCVGPEAVAEADVENACNFLKRWAVDKDL